MIFTTSNFKTVPGIALISVITAYLLMLGMDIGWQRWVIFKYEWSEVSRVHRLFNTNREHEIPVFGGSFAERNYYFDSLGTDFYSYGLAGSNFQKMYPLLEEEMSKSRSTPIILDFYMNTLRAKDDENIRVRNFIPVAGRGHIKQLLSGFSLFEPYYIVPGLRYFGQYMEYWTDAKKQEKEADENEFKQGGAYYLEATEETTFRELVANRVEMTESFQIDHDVEAHFLSILEKRPDRQFIIVVSPQHWSAYEKSIDIKAMEEYLVSLTTRFKHLEVLVFDGKDYPDECFKDTTHLNAKGARRFSGQLRAELDRILTLSSR